MAFRYRNSETVGASDRPAERHEHVVGEPRVLTKKCLSLERHFPSFSLRAPLSSFHRRDRKQATLFPILALSTKRTLPPEVLRLLQYENVFVGIKRARPFRCKLELRIRHCVSFAGRSSHRHHPSFPRARATSRSSHVGLAAKHERRLLSVDKWP